MNKKINKNRNIIFLFSILFIILFSHIEVHAEFQTGLYTNDTKENRPISEVQEKAGFKLTYFGGKELASQNPSGKSFSETDFTKNDKYGWCEYNYNGENYVVLAGAAYSLFDSTTVGPFEWKDYIHYFHVGWSYKTEYETIEFKFEDSSFDSEIYKGILLDSRGSAMRVGENEPQILDVYMGTDGESNSAQGEVFNQKKVIVTDDGTFSSSAGSSKTEVEKRNIKELVLGGINLLADTIQTCLGELLIDMNSDDEEIKLTYTREEIEADKTLQKQIEVKDAEEIGKVKTIKNVNVPNYVDNKSGQSEQVYNESTEIPIITADMYSGSINIVNAFDIDFFNQSGKNKNGFFKVVKGIVSTCSHIVLYLSALLIMTMIIWRSILLVFSTIGDSPEGVKESKEIIDNVVSAICIICLIYVFMTLMMYFYREILKIFLNGEDSIYLIRVNVQNTYSFNTNFIGYLKYMTLKSDVMTTFGASLLYLATAVGNIFWFGFMFFRMFIIGGLTIIAPFTAVMTLLGKKPRKGFHVDNILNLKSWASIYLKCLWIPLIIGVILYKILIFVG